MAAPRDVKGPWEPRGLSDYPEQAPYGSAILAQNVTLENGYLEPRKGSVLFARPQSTISGTGCSRFGLVRQIFSRDGSSVLLMVSVVRTGVAAGMWEVSLVSPGGAIIQTLIPAYLAAADNPSTVAFLGRYLLFLPVVGGRQVLEITTTNIQFWHLDNTNRPISDGDPGDYLSTANYDHIDASFGWAHEGRLFLAGLPGDEAAFVRNSTANDLWGFPKANWFGVGDNADAITGGASFGQSMVVFTRRSIYIVDYTGQGAVKSRCLTQHTGCVNHNSICYASGMLIFQSDTGLMGMDQAGTVTELSREIHNTYLRNRADFSRVSVAHIPEKHQVWCLFPANARILVMDLRASSWVEYNWRPEINISAGSICPYLLANGTLPVCGYVNTDDNAGYVISFDSSTRTDYNRAAHTISAYDYLWKSNPVPILGHHQVYLFRWLRVEIMDIGTGKTMRLFWDVESQGGVSGLPYPANQTAIVQSINPRSLVSRVEESAVYEFPDVGLPDAYVAWEGGEQWFPQRVSIGASNKGRYIQIGVSSDGVSNQFGLRSFEFDTRREDGRR